MWHHIKYYLLQQTFYIFNFTVYLSYTERRLLSWTLEPMDSGNIIHQITPFKVYIIYNIYVITYICLWILILKGYCTLICLYLAEGNQLWVFDSWKTSLYSLLICSLAVGHRFWLDSCVLFCHAAFDYRKLNCNRKEGIFNSIQPQPHYRWYPDAVFLIW